MRGKAKFLFFAEIASQDHPRLCGEKFSRILAVFGGGGHVCAAGCTMSGSPYDVINNLTLYIEKQLLAEEEEETTEEEA